MKRAPLFLFLLLTVIGVARIAATYRPIAQTSDEAANLACGMQWLDLGRYDYGPFHPPLARIAMAVGPYLYGGRSQKLPDRWKEGNAILDKAPRYNKALTLARVGILPFFVLATVLVWLWSRRLLGEWGGLAPVFVFTNLPPVLAHAGLATSDMAVGAGVLAAVFACASWLETPDWRRGLWLGCGLALALLTKFSSVLLVPVCVIVLVGLRGMRTPPDGGGSDSVANRRRKEVLTSLALALVTALLLVWGAYRFSWGRISSHLAEDAAGQTGIIAKVPAVWWHLLERTPIPAPELIDGFWQVHNHVDGGHAAYLLGSNSTHGWWYFFPVALGLKTPLGILILAAIGWFALVRERLRPFDWRWWAPPVAGLAILLACLPSSLNIGVRYVLPLFPMLAMTSGMGAVYLLRRRERRWLWSGLAAALLLWTAISSAAAHPDYIAYFNEIPGGRPERFLVDSDLDWGQDMHLLERALKQHHVTYIHLACQYTGDDARLDLPAWDGLEPYQRVSGWVAVSFTRTKTYGWVLAQQQGRSETAFAWLEGYRPIERIGKSILLYYIPEKI